MVFYHSGGRFSVVVTTFLWGWWAGSGGVLSNFAFRFNLRFCCLQICSDYGLYQESIDINSANHDPRSPCGERHANRIGIGEWVKFQPTPPSREATDKAITEYFSYKIFQSTPPSREATSWTRSSSVRTSDFNPHLPRGRRPLRDRTKLPAGRFQPTPPSREATC